MERDTDRRNDIEPKKRRSADDITERSVKPADLVIPLPPGSFVLDERHDRDEPSIPSPARLTARVMTGEIEIDPAPAPLEAPPIWPSATPPPHDLAAIQRALAVVELQIPERPSNLEIAVAGLDERQARTGLHVEVLIAIGALILVALAVIIVLLAVKL